MDTITHTLFGIGLYKASDKERMIKYEKRALFVTTVGASLIPDIDVMSQLWDTAGQYQMWHRGITHSILIAPLWALMFLLLNRYFFKVRAWRFYWIGLLAVLIHITSDALNAWGTGYLEPFSTIRLTYGTVPIIDFVIWVIFLIAFLYNKFLSKRDSRIFKVAWLLIALHIVIQTTQGTYLLQKYGNGYDHATLSASFVPWSFQIIGKNENKVDILSANIFSEATLTESLTSIDYANLDELFSQNPRAKTLVKWSPFVVIVDNDQETTVYDPRFYRNGSSFLNESIKK